MNGIEVVRRGLARETVITVKHWPSRELQPCVCTPNMSTMVVIDPSLWTPGDLAAHAKRLGGGIAGGLPAPRKGGFCTRLTSISPPVGKQLAWHSYTCHGDATNRFK
jgi:hypothetical protein